MSGELSMDLVKILQDNLRPYLGENAESTLLLVAFSGGRDSVALLAALHRLSGDGGFKLAAAHFDHGLRGAESDGDREFCRRFCAERGIEFAAKLCRELSPDMPNLEARARRLRYGWLLALREEYLRQGWGAVWLLTAHHLEDRAETVLLHLLRGSGTAGLAAMQRQSGCLLRPLLSTPRGVLEQFLAAEGLSWREDGSNACRDFLRNRVRLDLWPRLTEINPKLAQNLGQTAEIAAAEEDFWADLLRQKMKAAEIGVGRAAYPWAALQDEPLALRRRLVRALWQAAKDEQVCKLNFGQVEAVLALAAGGSLHLSGGVAAKRRQKMLILECLTDEEMQRRRTKSRSGQRL